MVRRADVVPELRAAYRSRETEPSPSIARMVALASLVLYVRTARDQHGAGERTHAA